MSAIDDLIAQVPEPRLPEQLKRERAEAQKTKKCGLVFDRHLPELVPIPKGRPRRGDLVARKGGSLTDAATGLCCGARRGDDLRNPTHCDPAAIPVRVRRYAPYGKDGETLGATAPGQAVPRR